MPDTMFHSLQFVPLLPLHLIYVLAGLCLLLTAVGFLRRMRGTVLRLVASALLLFWLSGPHILHKQYRTLPETALVLVDQSPSMDLKQRAAVARQAASILNSHVPEGLSLRTVTVRGSHGSGTQLTEALAQAVTDIPPDQFAGAIMITDGESSDASSHLPDSLNPSDGHEGHTAVPLHVLLTASGEEKDRRLRILQAPPYAVIGQPATLKVEIDDAGPDTTPGAPATLSVRTDGGEPMEMQVQTGAPQTIEIPITHPGKTLISLSASELPGEVSTLNNRDVISVNGVRDRLKVLLVSGAPNQGERVWRRLLKADPSVDLVHFTILRPPSKDDGTPLSDLALIPFPIRELFYQKINQFDLIILDGFENQAILPQSYLRNIARFVRSGGGLFLIAGPEFTGPGSLQDTPLGDVLPAHVAPDASSIVTGRFRPHMTNEGLRHPVTSDLLGAPSGSSLPAPTPDHQPTTSPGEWGPWYRYLRPDSTSGDVLLETGDKTPLLVLNRVEQGRVALMLSDQIWLWSRGEDGGGPQAELLRRISHWLMKEPDLEEDRLLAKFEDGGLHVTLRSARDTPPSSVSVRAPDGQQTTLALKTTGTGTASAFMTADQPGIWEISDGTHRIFAAPPLEDPAEYGELRATASLLKPVVTASRGSIRWIGDNPKKMTIPALTLASPSHFASDNNALSFPQRHASVMTGSDSRALLPSWLVLCCFLALMLLAWYRENRL
ncbi:MAG: VWA domain-containing protein [Acetobacter sp.]|nr:VWA domain-containing protein [Acetobacter sp.]